MKFEINKKFILLRVQEKSKVNLYILIDVETGEKLTSVGIKEKGLVDRDLVEATIAIRTKGEKFDTNDGVKYVEVLNTFVSKIEKVKL